MFGLYSKLISLCLLAFGISACDPAVEYGSPSAKYRVSGKVVSSETSKKPVPNIRVVMIPQVKGNPNELLYLRGDTVFTDVEGKFEVNRNDFPYNTFNIKLQDVDGETNGLFEEKLEVVEFKDSDYKGGKDWYQGLAQKDLGTIELTPKAK